MKKRKQMLPPREPDALVDLARTLHDEAGMGYRTIAKRLGVRLYTVRDWLRYRRRT